jgi:hypothetical protein
MLNIGDIIIKDEIKFSERNILFSELNFNQFEKDYDNNILEILLESKKFNF